MILVSEIKKLAFFFLMVIGGLFLLKMVPYYDSMREPYTIVFVV